jgi:hypothetical protein
LNFVTSGVHAIGIRQQSPLCDIFAFSIMAGHQRIIKAACPHPFNLSNPEGGENEISPLSMYAIKSGQC